MQKLESSPRARLQLATLAVIGIAALGIRFFYIRMVIVDQPLRGDAFQYFAYMWNLLKHATFSSSAPNAASVIPDSFRDPGYPAFLAVIALIKGTGDSFFCAVREAQCVLSAATGWIFSILTRRWVGFWPAIAIAGLWALWPPSVTLCEYVLGETLFGLLIALALFATDYGLRSGGILSAGIAGFAYGIAALTNAVILPFAPLVGVWMAWRVPAQRLFWITFACCATLPALGWGIRSAFVPPSTSSSTDRVMMNLVQGSWPEYHESYLPALHGDAKSVRAVAVIDAEYQRLKENQIEGARAIVKRLLVTPGRSLAWYLSKPGELWGWTLGIAQGDIYIVATRESPFEVRGGFGAVKWVCRILAPILTSLALAGLLFALRPGSGIAPAFRIAAWLGLFVTLVYGVLQSDARYAAPFRCIQILLAIYAGSVAQAYVRRIMTRNIAT